ncbi:MAG: hypothetical protein JO075_13905, partial [Acidimicrobiia bacterium]|nr:hypothetical protein [Acidimicrobiia bacterium]
EHAYDEHGQYIGAADFEPGSEVQTAWADLAAEYSTSDRPPIAADDEAEPAVEAQPASDAEVAGEAQPVSDAQAADDAQPASDEPA